MKKSTVVISALVITLVASNAWWAYQLLDAGVSYTYQGASLEESQQALAQTLAIIEVMNSGDASRDRVVAAANKAWSAGEPFEKDGYFWVGRLGLRFNGNGELVEVTL